MMNLYTAEEYDEACYALYRILDEIENATGVDLLTEAIVKLFTEADLSACHTHSYEKAKNYLTSEVEKRWEMILNQKM